MYLSNIINMCFQMPMFPIYMESYFSVVWVLGESLFLIVPNAKVAKLWCSSIGRTKVIHKLTRTQNRLFFKLWPRHFLGRIFWKNFITWLINPENYPPDENRCKNIFWGLESFCPFYHKTSLSDTIRRADKMIHRRDKYACWWGDRR